MKTKMSVALTWGFVALGLTACGGGGGGGSGNSGGGGTITAYTPSATVLAAKTTNYATPFWAVTPLAGANGSCSGTDMSTTVYVLPNTVTYAARGVSELSQQQVAEYSEKVVTEIKSALGLSSGTGYTGQRIQICTQTGLFLGVAQGMGDMKGFRVTSSDSTQLDKGFLYNDFDMYKSLIKHEMAHTYHNAAMGTDNAILDTWFAEGLAEFIASGKSSKSKAEIMNLVNTQNPIAVLTNSGTGNLSYYPAFQSSVAYLFDANGAKNNLSLIPAFLTLAKSNFDSRNTNCAITNTCTTARELAFQQSFEATFKEADGTAMKLRTGTNNLQSTIATRLTNVLQ